MRAFWFTCLCVFASAQAIISPSYATGSAQPRSQQKIARVVDPQIYYAGSESINPAHECSQYHWAHTVHTGGDENCSAPWKTLERNWSPKDSPVEVSKQLEMKKYDAGEARFKELLSSLTFTDEILQEAVQLIEENLVTLFPDVVIDVGANYGGRELKIPLMHHVVKMAVEATANTGRGVRDLPHFREMILRLLGSRVSPSIATVNAQDNPPFVEILTHSFLDVELCDTLSESFVITTPFLRKDRKSGVALPHLLFRDSEADIRNLVALLQQTVSDNSAIEDSALLISVLGSTAETVVDSHATRGLLAVSDAFVAVVKSIIHERGRGSVKRKAILDVQDELATHYIEKWLQVPTGFDFGEWAIVTPANHFSIFHLAARQNMPKALKAVIDPLPKVFQGRQLKELMGFLLSGSDAWMQRTPLHFAAFHHGADSEIFKMISLLNEKWLPKNNPIGWTDGVGKTPMDIAIDVSESNSLEHAIGGRPKGVIYTAAESWGWNEAPFPSTINTEVCQINEARGLILKGRHLAQFLIRADPTIVRAGNNNPATSQAFSYTNVDKLLRQALQHNDLEFLSRTAVTNGVPFSAAVDGNTAAQSLNAFLNGTLSDVMCVRLPEFQTQLNDLQDAIADVPGMGPRQSSVTCMSRNPAAATPENFHSMPILDALLVGQRHWLVWPPSSASMSTQKSDGSSDGTRTKLARAFTQEAGDVVIVPKGWSFSTQYLQAGINTVVPLHYSPTTPRVWDRSVLKDSSLVVGDIKKIPQTQGQGPVQSFMDQPHNGWYGSNPNAGKLEVIGAGFGRTGTSTMKQVFEELGFGRCYHMLENVNMNHTHLWNNSMQLPQLRRILEEGSYRSGVDYPFCLYYKEWMEMFPDAKIVLTVRSNVSKWWRSTRKTLYKPMSRWFPIVSRLLTAPAESQNQLFMWERQLLWEGIYQGKFLIEDHATQVFNNHVREVQTYAKKLGREVLVYSVESGEGWKPLCDFLNVPVPTKPFPRANERDTRAQTAFWLHVGICTIFGLLLMVPIAFIYLSKTLLNFSPVPGVVGAAFFYAFVQLIHYWARTTESSVYAISD